MSDTDKDKQRHAAYKRELLPMVRKALEHAFDHYNTKYGPTRPDLAGLRDVLNICFAEMINWDTDYDDAMSTIFSALQNADRQWSDYAQEKGWDWREHEPNRFMHAAAAATECLTAEHRPADAQLH